MKLIYSVSSVVMVLFMSAGVPAQDTSAQEGVSTYASESEAVSAASGKSVSAKSACPSGKRIIGGGGECYGFRNTRGRAALTRSAPVPDESAWVVECTNTNPAPGEIQARAWAICADPGILEE